MSHLEARIELAKITKSNAVIRMCANWSLEQLLFILYLAGLGHMLIICRDYEQTLSSWQPPSTAQVLLRYHLPLYRESYNEYDWLLVKNYFINEFKRSRSIGE